MKSRLRQWISTKSATIFKKKKVKPKCYDSRYMHVIGADGYYYPCCFTRVALGRKDLKQLLGEDFDLLNIRKYNQGEILRSAVWPKLYRSFFTQAMPTCEIFCARQQKRAQDLEFDGLNQGLELVDRYQVEKAEPQKKDGAQS